MEQSASGTFRELTDTSTDAFDGQLVPFFEPDEELNYRVRAPTRADREESPGVLIYISPKRGARMPESWGQILDKHNLVWVGAENSGNEIHVARRVGLALLGPAVARRTQPIDPSRVLLAGFSGGGRVASMMMPAYPRRFAGAMFICGANPLFAVSQEIVDALAQRPMVFLTGTGDFNLEDTRMAIATYRQAGLAKAQLMVVDGLGHALPLENDLDAALEHLCKQPEYG